MSLAKYLPTACGNISYLFPHFNTYIVNVYLSVTLNHHIIDKIVQNTLAGQAKQWADETLWSLFAYLWQIYQVVCYFQDSLKIGFHMVKKIIFIEQLQSTEDELISSHSNKCRTFFTKFHNLQNNFHDPGSQDQKVSHVCLYRIQQIDNIVILLGCNPVHN